MIPASGPENVKPDLDFSFVLPVSAIEKFPNEKLYELKVFKIENPKSQYRNIDLITTLKM